MEFRVQWKAKSSSDLKMKLEVRGSKNGQSTTSSSEAPVRHVRVSTSGHPWSSKAHHTNNSGRSCLACVALGRRETARRSKIFSLVGTLLFSAAIAVARSFPRLFLPLRQCHVCFRVISAFPKYFVRPPAANAGKVLQNIARAVRGKPVRLRRSGCKNRPVPCPGGPPRVPAKQ